MITSHFLPIPSAVLCHVYIVCVKTAVEINIIWVYPKIGCRKTSRGLPFVSINMSLFSMFKPCSQTFRTNSHEPQMTSAMSTNTHRTLYGCQIIPNPPTIKHPRAMVPMWKSALKTMVSREGITYMPWSLFIP